jgi:hypothetical protein
MNAAHNWDNRVSCRHTVSSKLWLGHNLVQRQAVEELEPVNQQWEHLEHVLHESDPEFVGLFRGNFEGSLNQSDFTTQHEFISVSEFQDQANQYIFISVFEYVDALLQPPPVPHLDGGCAYMAQSMLGPGCYPVLLIQKILESTC